MDVQTCTVKHIWLQLLQQQEEKKPDVRLEMMTLESACEEAAWPSLQGGDVNVESCQHEECCLLLSAHKRSHHSLQILKGSSSSSHVLPEQPGPDGSERHTAVRTWVQLLRAA